MGKLHRKPAGSNGEVHNISPQGAGWTYVGFKLYHLDKGDSIKQLSDDREVILVLVEGKA